MFVIVNLFIPEVIGLFDTKEEAKAYWKSFDLGRWSIANQGTEDVFIAEVGEPLPVRGLENK